MNFEQLDFKKLTVDFDDTPAKEVEKHEELLQETHKRFVLFPIEYENVSFV
jgi:hypothetical protein